MAVLLQVLLLMQGIDLDLYMWLEQMPPTALPLLPLLRLDLLLLGLPGMELLVLAFILEMEIARYAAYLDAYTGPGTATDSLGRYVPKVGTRGMFKKSNKHQLLHLSLSLLLLLLGLYMMDLLYMGYGTNEAVRDATLAS